MRNTDRRGEDWSDVMSIPVGRARRVLLIVILATICLGVASTIATTLTEFESWSVQSVGGATLIAACLLIVAGRTLEKRRLRAASIIAICLIVVEYLLVLASFWQNKLPMLESYGSQFSALLMCIPIAGAPSIGVVRLLHYPTRRFGALIALPLAAVSLIAMTAGALLETDHQHLLWAGLWLEVYSLILLANLIGVTRPIRFSWRWIGTLCTCIGYGVAVWTLFVIDDGPWPTALTWFTCAAIICGHLNLSLRAPLPQAWRWLRWASVTLVVSTSLLLSYQVTFKPEPEIWMRGIYVLAISAGATTFAMYILKRIYRKPFAPMIAPEGIRSLLSTCPGCGTVQPLGIGDSACSECGMLFSIRIGEPRCRGCGYLLYRIKSDRCPECGTTIGTAAQST
jgi:hypothetical protein